MFAKESDPANGTVVVNPDGSYTYTPDPNYSGTDSFTYTVTDPASGESLTRTVNLTVTPVNDAPDAVGTIADQSDADADTVTALDASGFFADIDSPVLTYSATGLPPGLSIDPATGVISGTIDNSASQGGAGGVYSVTVTATDGDGASVDQVFDWTVTNPAPVANDDAATTNEDVTVTGNVLTGAGADSDPDGDTLVVSGFTIAGDATVYAPGDSVTIAGVGVFTLAADGSYSFVPAANWNGVVPTVNYTISDGEGGGDSADLVITVRPVNDAPVIVGPDQSGTVVEAGNLDDGTPTMGDPEVSGQFVASDVDSATLTWSIVGTPDATYGTFAMDPATGAWSYDLDNALPATQALNEGDSVPLTYVIQVSDGVGGTTTREVVITVTGTNDSPVAASESGSVTEAGVNPGNSDQSGIATASGNVLTNDTDVDAGETALLEVTGVSIGSTGGTVGSGLAGTYGSLTLQDDGAYSYALDNSSAATQSLEQGEVVTEVFTYTIADPNGATSTSTLTITVTGTNDRPVITSNAGDAMGTVVEAGSGVAGDDTATGQLSASDVDDNATQSWSLIANNGTYGTISIDPATGAWTYTLDNSRAATQALNVGDTGSETFVARVTDQFGAFSEQTITISVSGSNDNVVGTTPNALVILPEDTSAQGTLQDYVSDVDNVIVLTGFQVDANGDGVAENYAPGATVTLLDANGNTRGAVTVEADGDYRFDPAPNYSGTVPPITYTVAESGGAAPPVTQTITFDVVPVSDALGLAADKTIATTEDTAVSLGLVAPVITDIGTGTTNGDNAERLGAITLRITGAGATGVTLVTGSTILTPVSGSVRIVLTDRDNVTSVPAPDNANGVYYLTTAQYQALQANPGAENGNNFTVRVSATSYEVDESGVILTGVLGATSTQIITVGVLAVTDGAALTIDGMQSTVDISSAEDTVIDLGGRLAATLNNPDGNAGTDNDGSERYQYVVSGLPVGTVVTIDGVTTTITDTVTSATSLETASATPPVITITPPANYSGDIIGATVTLNSRDTDADSIGTINTVSSAVTLNLYITPVAGDVAASDVTVAEDLAVAFLAGVRVTDTGTTTGSEIIDSVAFTVPAGWTVTPPADPAGWTYSVVGVEATITFDATLTEAQREAVLDGFLIEPPAHSSVDATINLSITSTDTNVVNGASVSDTATVNRPITVTVTPVAERADTDSDGVGGNDVTLGPDQIYTATGLEDAWFALGQTYNGASNTTGGRDLLAGWSDADSDEFVYAVLTPTLSSASPGDDVIGTQLRYSTDGGATWITQTYVGEPVWVPQQYLDTLQVKLPADVAGTLDIGVQAGTVDYDDDMDVAVLPLDPPKVSAAGVSVAISGSATWSLVTFDPVADAVTMALNGRATGLEDTAIPLVVRTTSSDQSETFNVTISNIPVGATITYGTDGAAQSFTAAPGSTSFLITDFDNSAPLSVTPPQNSNVDFSLTVTAVSVDGPSEFAPVSRTIAVGVTGVADLATVTLSATDFSTTEAALDSSGNRVALNQLITSVTSPDADGSETATLRITGLVESFNVTGATIVTTGTGAERVWVVPANNLANVSIVTPPNFSGTVNFQVAGVTTENDGDSRTASSTNVSYTVTPSPEAIITNAATLIEDQISLINLTIIQQNGDTNENLGRIFIATDYASGANYSLYVNGVLLENAELATTTLSGQNYYVVPADQVASLGAMGDANLDGDLGSLDFLYEVIDPSSDSSLGPVSDIKPGSLALTATPVTDTVDASIDNISLTSATGTVSENVANDDASPDTAEITQAGTVRVNMHVESFDTDGSEHLVRILITGVPEAVFVTGASQISPDTWLLVYDAGNARAIGSGGIDVPIDFIVGAGASDGLSSITMTALVQDQGQLSSTPAGIQSDSVTWNLVLDLPDNGGLQPPVIEEWTYNRTGGSEDTALPLGDLFDATVTPSDAAQAYSYTVSITELPPGTLVSGMTLTVIDGVQTWTANVMVPAGGDSQAALDNLLDQITITPPANSNDNNADFAFEARLIGSVLGGPSQEADATAEVPINPVTDPAVITVTADDVDEGTDSLTATISVQNPADGSFGQVVEGKLYVQLSTVANDAGVVSDSSGNALALTTVTGVAGVPDGDYYVVNVASSGGSVDLTYTVPDPQTLQPGSVSFTAYAQSREVAAGNTVTSTASETAMVEIVNNGVTVSSEPVTGDESNAPDPANAIELEGLGAVLVDNDGSETIQSILIAGVPVGFLVYVGNDPNDPSAATLASNAGGNGNTNTWILSSNGAMPPYVAILPALNWSGTLDDLSLVVESGEATLPESRVDSIPLEAFVVVAVANGVTIDPSLSFGREGTIIPLNLNAAMADAMAATAAVADGSTETTTLQITGLGEFAAFYVGTTIYTAVAYDDASDTYTISGLTQDNLDALGVVQAADALSDQDGATSGVQLAVSAFTVESGNGNQSTPVEDFLTLAIRPVIATTGNDQLLWDGGPLNGRAGTDTVSLRYGESVDHSDLSQLLRNVEVLDLSVPGENSVVGGLSISDVLSITGSTTGRLTINGDGDDSVILSNTMEWTTTGAVVDGHVVYSSTSSGVSVAIDEDVNVSYAA
ncbi:MAG: hypothetical protein CL574_11065 [Altererythrobacter sp.]|nr:hypothetical protein [Altererythrobacter sp.]